MTTLRFNQLQSTPPHRLPPARPPRPPRGGWLALFGALSLASLPAQPTSDADGEPVVPLGSAAPEDVFPSTPFLFGQVSIEPSFTYRFSQSDDLRDASGELRDTEIQHFSPGVVFGFGEHWTLGYSPTWRVYSDAGFRDSVAHLLRLAGITEYQGWRFELSQSYTSAEESLAETGRQTDYEYYRTYFSVGHPLNSRTALEVELRQDIRLAQRFVDVHVWDATAWFDYYFAPGLKAGLGAGGGYASVDPGANMTVQHAKARGGWRVTNKVALDVETGAEKRSFQSGGRSDMTNALFGASLNYHPFETTTLTLGYDHVVSPSHLRGLFTERDGVSATLRQRLLGRLQLSAMAVHRRVSYLSAEETADAGRLDERRSYSLGLTTTILRRSRWTVFYRTDENPTNVAGFEYSSRQYGIEISIR